MAAYSSTGSGDFNNNATWGGGGHPTGAGDTALINTGHAITAAAAVVCGAITLGALPGGGTGSLVATAAPNTITSVTNNGTGAVTLGATTFAGAFTHNGAGTTTCSGAWTGLSGNSFFDALVMNGNITTTGTILGINAFTMGAYTLSGMTGNLATGGTWNVAAGATITFNSASARTITISAGSTVNFNGTAGAGVINVGNAGAGAAGLSINGTFNGTYYTLKTSLNVAAVTAVIYSRYGQHGITGTHSGWFDVNYLYCPAGFAPTATLRGFFRNVAIGYLRDGSASAPSVGISNYASVHFVNAVINATTQVATLGGSHSVVVENLGYLDPAMLPGTASALDAVVVDPGIHKTWLYTGTIERSAVNPRTGTYHLRMTPSSIVTATVPLECAVNVPIKSGDSLSISAWASRSGDTSDCVVMVGDPEQAWFTTVTSAETLTNTATYYRLTVALATAGGTGAKGTVRVVFRVTEYTAGNYVDVDDMAIAVT